MIEKYTRFMILSSPRSGTHMLRTSLNGHPHIEAKSEIFNPGFLKTEAYDENTPVQEIVSKHLFYQYDPNIRAVGFILHRSGAQFGNWPTLWTQLEKDKDLKIIMLNRHNLLRRYLSYCKMRDKNRSITACRRYFTVNELKQEFIRHEKEVAEFEQRFSGHEIIHVSYEELCSDYRATMYHLQHFLGVPVKPISPLTEKNQSKDIDQEIGNFNTLRDAFAETRWKWFFEQGESVAANLVVSIEI